MWGCGCCHEFPSSPRPAWQWGTAMATLWAGAVPGWHSTGSTLCCIRHGWKRISPMPKEEQIPQAAAAQDPDKFANRTGRRSGRDPGKPRRAEQGAVQRLRGMGRWSSHKGNQLQAQEGHKPCQSSVTTEGFPFCLLQHFPFKAIKPINTQPGKPRLANAPTYPSEPR